VKSSPPSPFETEQVRAILRWRWIVLFACISYVSIVEVLEHQVLTIELAREFLVYGLAMPIGIWVLLTLLAHHMAQRASLSNDLERQRQFSQQLAHYRDREELADFMTRFPHASMPVDRVILFQYDHLKAQMEFAAEWSADEQVRPPTRYSPLSGNVPYVRAISKSTGLHESTTCPLITSMTKTLGGKHFCLPLVHDSILVGVLRLRCLPGNILSPEQTQFLNSISAQMALALALSIAFPRQLTEAQQAERRRVAYDLHDSLAQQMGYLHLTLDRLASDERIAAMDWLQSDLDRLREVADDSYLQIRTNLNLLRNWSSMDLGETIDSYIGALRPKVSFEIEYRVTGNPVPLTPLDSEHIFSLIQETLNNIQNHARAQHACVELAWYTSQLEITVTDDGAGFDAAASPNADRHGIRILRERIQELQGEMHITSAPTAGTCVKFEIPLRTRRS
jgi:signal transduction histidine kinase